VSWDIFVQDIPENAVSLDDIAEDFKPKLLVSRSNVIGAILKFAPFSDVSDLAWVRIQGPATRFRDSCSMSAAATHRSASLQGFFKTFGCVR